MRSKKERAMLGGWIHWHKEWLKCKEEPVLFSSFSYVHTSVKIFHLLSLRHGTHRVVCRFQNQPSINTYNPQLAQLDVRGSYVLYVVHQVTRVLSRLSTISWRWCRSESSLVSFPITINDAEVEMVKFFLISWCNKYLMTSDDTIIPA